MCFRCEFVRLNRSNSWTCVTCLKIYELAWNLINFIIYWIIFLWNRKITWIIIPLTVKNSWYKLSLILSSNFKSNHFDVYIWTMILHCMLEVGLARFLHICVFGQVQRLWKLKIDMRYCLPTRNFYKKINGSNDCLNYFIVRKAIFIFHL